MTESSPRVLVLLAAHNGSKWIRPQLESILAQERVQVHVAVRDDGSTDETLQVLAPFQADRRVTLTSAPSGGGSAAQNFFSLIDENSSEGFEFVAFSDQDDVWIPDKLARSSARLAENGCSGYSSATTATWPDGRTRALRQNAATREADFLFEGAGQGCTFVLTAQFYARARAFLADHPKLRADLHYHDWAVYALARTWGLRWFFDRTSTVAYRQHDENDTGARGTKAALRKRLVLIRDGWYRKQLAAIADLCSAASPSNRIVRDWRALLLAPAHGHRRLRIATFCLRSGRRRSTDNLVLAIAAIAGWI